MTLRSDTFIEVYDDKSNKVVGLYQGLELHNGLVSVIGKLDKGLKTGEFFSYEDICQIRNTLKSLNTKGK